MLIDLGLTKEVDQGLYDARQLIDIININVHGVRGSWEVPYIYRHGLESSFYCILT